MIPLNFRGIVPAECGFYLKNIFFEKKVFFVKNMLTGTGKSAILSELLGTNCFQKNDNNILFQKK